MPDSLDNITHLSDNEIQKYEEWARALQIAHVEECGGPLDGLCITFEITNLGTTVIAHTGCAPTGGAHVFLRD